MTVSASGSRLPMWLLGVCNFPLGAYGAVMVLTVPQLLAAQGVAQTQIAHVTAIGLIPGFCSFFISPILDWRFTRRRYATALCVITALLVVIALGSLHDLPRLTACLFAGSAAVTLYTLAVGGWLGSVTGAAEKGRLGAWFAVANIGGGGITAAIAIALLRHLPFAQGTWLLAGIMLLPLPLFPWIPTPQPDQKLARESFKEFFADVARLVRQPTILWMVALFVVPAASFALTNALSGLGRDFATSEQTVATITGTGVTVAGLVGSLLVPRLVVRTSPQRLYILIGVIGAAFTLVVATLPRTPSTFAVAVLGENAFQSAAFAVETALVLGTIAEGSALASTQYGLLISAPSLPIAYMQAVDGIAYGVGGIGGTFVTDAAFSVVGCAMAAVAFRQLRVKAPAQALARRLEAIAEVE